MEKPSRRQFLTLSATGLAGLSLSPRASAQGSAAPVQPPARTGNGAFVFETIPGWGLPPDKNFGPTHGGIARDKAGNIYASTDGPASIFVYKPDGSYSGTIAAPFAGLHSLQIVEEGGEEFLYGAWLVGRKAVKLKLDGTPVWQSGAPVEAGFKAAGDWKPTAVVSGPDGTIYVCDGYGSSKILMFDKQGNFKKTFAGTGSADGQCKNCHGMTLDTRFGQPLLLVIDRENRRLSHFDLDGKFVGHHSKNLRRPCQVSFHGDHAAVSEILGRVTILDKTGTPVAFLGDNPNKKQWDNDKVKPADYKEGVFQTPHGIHWEPGGQLIVSEWSAAGRISRLKPV